GSNNLNPSTVIMARFVDNSNHYSFIIKNHSEWWLGYVQGGSWNTLDNGNFSYNATTWYTMTLTVQGSTISAAINGKTLTTDTDRTFASGMIGFSTKATSEFDNVLVTTNLISPTPTATATQPPPPTATTAPTPTATTAPSPTPTATSTPTATPTATPAPTPTATPAP